MNEQEQHRARESAAQVECPAVGQGTGLQSRWLAALAAECGLERVGLVALPQRSAEREEKRFSWWVESGFADSMDYLSRRNERGELVRARLERTLAWARSAVVCWVPYACGGRSGAALKSRATAGLETGATVEVEGATVGEAAGLIARYARTSKPAEDGEGQVPSDYHKVLLKRLRRLEVALRARLGEFQSRAFVDTTPYSERALAVEAGLGWIGKNGCLIVPGWGSWGFLAVLFVSVELSELAENAELAKAEEPAGRRVSQLADLVPNRCGSCTRCIDACPTRALTAPGVVDGRRCIACLTIEHKGPIAPEWMARMGNWVFGCDICQEVCPWCSAGGNALGVAADPELAERPELAAPSLDWLGGLSEPEFERLFNGSPVRRAGYAGLMRNVAIAMGNGGAGKHCERLQAWSNSGDEGLRAAARWARERQGR